MGVTFFFEIKNFLIGGISLENYAFLVIFAVFGAFRRNHKISLTAKNFTLICPKLKSNGSFENCRSRAFQNWSYNFAILMF